MVNFMQKKVLSFLTLLILGIITFTSCSASQKKTEGVVTVSLSGWQSSPTEQQLLQKVLNNFEAKHPGIKVKYDVIAEQYMDVMKTRLIGETAADVFYLDALEAPALMSHGVLEPLNSYVSEFELTDFEPRLLNAFKQHGEIYGFPKDFSTLALFYNKKAFKIAELSQPPKTWNELREYSKRLTINKNNDKKVEQYGFSFTPELARQYFMLQAFGGKLIDSNGWAEFASDSASLKGLQLIIDQYRRDKTSTQPTDVGAASDDEIFGQGKAAMVIEGTWLIPYLKQTFPAIEFATAEVPTVGGKKGTMAYTVAYVINKQSKHKPEAWQLISYLTGKEGMKAWTSQGTALPTRKSVAAALGYDKNPLYAPFLTGAAYATIWQAGENLPTILTNFNNQFISAMLGEQPLSIAMQKAQETADREIELAK